MRRLALVMGLLVLAVSNLALADEVAADSAEAGAVNAAEAVAAPADSGAALQENSSAAPALELNVPAYMLPPENGAYPQEANVSKSLGASRVGIGLAVANLSWSIASSILVPYGFWPGMYFHWSSNNMSLLRLILGVPLINFYASKTKMWHFYSKHRALDIAAWTMFGFGVALGFTNNFIYDIIDQFVHSCGDECGYYDKRGVALSMSMLLLGGLTAATAFILFSVKARICYNMAVAAKKHNQGQGVAEIASDKRQVALMPSLTPYLDANRKISGGTVGIALTF